MHQNFVKSVGDPGDFPIPEVIGCVTEHLFRAVTVAILAQGTSWAVAVTQTFLDPRFNSGCPEPAPPRTRLRHVPAEAMSVGYFFQLRPRLGMTTHFATNLSVPGAPPTHIFARTDFFEVEDEGRHNWKNTWAFCVAMLVFPAFKKYVIFEATTHMARTLCPSGLRGWTQVPLAQAARVQIPQVSKSHVRKVITWNYVH